MSKGWRASLDVMFRRRASRKVIKFSVAARIAGPDGVEEESEGGAGEVETGWER